MSDLFKFLDKMNAEQYDYIDRLSEEDVKKLNTFMLLGWINGAQQNRAAHVLLTDEFVNDKVFSLHKHPRLLLKLLIAANGNIDKTRYQFEKFVSSEKEKEIKQIAKYYKIGYSTAKQYARVLPKEDIETIKEFYNE